MSESPYLGRWLLVTGILFAGSAAAYALRLGRAHLRGAHSEAPKRTPERRPGQ